MLDEAVAKEHLDSNPRPFWEESDIRAAIERAGYLEGQIHRADSLGVGGVLVEIVRTNGERAIARLCVSKSGVGAEMEDDYFKNLKYICYNGHPWEHPDVWWPRPGGQEGEGCYANLLGLYPIEEPERVLAAAHSMRLLSDGQGPIRNPRAKNFTVIRLDGSKQDIREIVKAKHGDEMVVRYEEEARRERASSKNGCLAFPLILILGAMAVWALVMTLILK